MKNLKLGLKIGLGFGTLILIAGLLGGMAMINMMSVGKQAERLAQEIAPEVAVANEVERDSLNTMYAMRGFAFTGQNGFWEQATKSLGDVEKNLAQAKELAQKYPRLVKLRENAEKASVAVAEYKKLAMQTHDTEKAMDADRKNMDQAAAEFMKSTEAYLKS